MSEFLDLVSDVETRAKLGSWIRGAVGEMDRIVDDSFPIVFGKNWRQKMSDFPTTARTKLLTYIFDHALETMAGRLNIDYRAANNQGASETNNFDCYLFEYTVENKLSLGVSATSFATGSKHNLCGKVKRILAVKVISAKYKSEKIFACIIDLSDAESSLSKWSAHGESGFSTLRVDISDSHIIVPICGYIKAGPEQRRKYVGVRYERFQADA